MASSSRQVSISLRNSSSTRRGAAFFLGRFGELIERAFEDRLAGEDAGDFVPARNVLGVVQEQDASFGGFVVLVRLFAAIVDGEFLEVGEDGERQLCRPGVAAELEGGADVGLDIDGGFLCFDEEFARAADAEAVVGGAGRFFDDERVFVDHVAVGFGVALAVGHVPAKASKKGSKKSRRRSVSL